MRAEIAPDQARASCERVTAELTEAGRRLWVRGSMFGRDRIAGRTRFGYGDDRLVAGGLVVEIASDLAASAISAMDAGRTYSASALIRQIIECEYLILLFNRDVEAAREWLNADRETLLSYWSPAKMRKRSGGTFSDTEYWAHCDTGGHPTPNARALLSSHSMSFPIGDYWDELAMHLDRLWNRVETMTSTLTALPL